MSWSSLTRRLTFANVAALMALVLALGGVGLAGGGRATGNVVGYARVRANGSVVGTKSLNVRSTNVTLESTSAYCFRNLPFRFRGAQVTIDYAAIVDGQTEQAEFAIGNPYGDCAGGNVQAEVATSDGTSFDPQPFFIVFYR